MPAVSEWSDHWFTLVSKKNAEDYDDSKSERYFTWYLITLGKAKAQFSLRSSHPSFSLDLRDWSTRYVTPLRSDTSTATPNTTALFVATGVISATPAVKLCYQEERHWRVFVYGYVVGVSCRIRGRLYSRFSIY